MYHVKSVVKSKVVAKKWLWYKKFFMTTILCWFLGLGNINSPESSLLNFLTSYSTVVLYIGIMEVRDSCKLHDYTTHYETQPFMVSRTINLHRNALKIVTGACFQSDMIKICIGIPNHQGENCLRGLQQLICHGLWEKQYCKIYKLQMKLYTKLKTK